ncbi:hypothetical protein V6Z11_A12G062000 [Gossypium hirsutum]
MTLQLPLLAILKCSVLLLSKLKPRKHWRLMMVLVRGNTPLDLDKIAWPFVQKCKMLSL